MPRLADRITCTHQRRFIIGVCAALAAGSLTANSSADIIIDNFIGIGTPNQWPVIQTTLGNTIVTESPVPGVLGGTRQSIIFGEFFASGADSNTVSVELGQLSFTSTAGGNGNLTLRYAGGGGDLAADFSAETGIQLTFGSFNFAGSVAVPISVVLDDGSNSATGNITMNSAGAQTLDFSFASFSGIGSLDLSSINSVLVSINGSTGGAYTLTELAAITVIPAPGVLGLMGVAGLATRRRRRRNA